MRANTFVKKYAHIFLVRANKPHSKAQHMCAHAHVHVRMHTHTRRKRPLYERRFGYFKSPLVRAHDCFQFYAIYVYVYTHAYAHHPKTAHINALEF